ncbi:MAG: hypothetical protein A3G18_08705 [Rhodospirillales bacterium RIFCSPLOWO2_12_FULL_58_28]|nr:MAG: hypothetical protein A3H92_00260 [Rhodospirillales bacterium RIFCSPLOWO2_02_FULL_58_16]OHC79776.1 MAG: hypothetical protein A3G18_08705 [Rhodospirillales bacterium RIFCSPLOWO2_12_FULL_58_28]
MTQDEVCEAIIGYMRSAVGSSRSQSITPSTRIYDAIDSYAIVELVSHLTVTLGKEIDFGEATTDDLETPESFSRFVAGLG